MCKPETFILPVKTDNPSLQICFSVPLLCVQKFKHTFAEFSEKYNKTRHESITQMQILHLSIVKFSPQII